MTETSAGLVSVAIDVSNYKKKTIFFLCFSNDSKGNGLIQNMDYPSSERPIDGVQTIYMSCALWAIKEIKSM